MPLPIVASDTSLHWDCQSCGICCRGSIVPLSDSDLARLEAQNWHEHPDYRGQPIHIAHGRRRRLAHRVDGSCVFLREDGLCRIHAEHGYDAKPTSCRMFPIQLAPQRRETELTIRCACPTASLGQGRPIETYLSTVREYVKRGELSNEPIHPPMLKSGEVRPWEMVEPVLDSLARQLTDERFPIVRRLAHGLQFVQRLERAATASWEPAELKRHIPSWESESVSAAAEFFKERKRPSRAAGMLFRLVALEHMRLLPSYVAKPSWGERLRLTSAACRVAWGGGSVPNLGCAFPAARFSRLEEPHNSMAIDVLAPLTRMFESTGRSYLYATAHRGGWSVVESLRALALAYPIGMWMMRWKAIEGPLTAEDVATIVVALDRGQGHAPLSGGQQRWRVGTLARIGALEPLLAWYARKSTS